MPDVPQWQQTMIDGGKLAGNQASSAKGKNQQENQKAYQQAAHPNVSGPTGHDNWTQNADGSWTESSGYGGPLEGANQGLMQQAADSYGKPFDDGSAARDSAINASYGQATSRLDPQWAERAQLQSSSLANQGLDMNSEAYKNAMGDFGRARNDAYTSAMNSAISNGNQAQALTFGQNMQARNAPLAALLQMRGLLPGAANSSGLNALNAANQYTQEQQQLGMQTASQGIAAAAGLAAVSDERAKTDIQRLPTQAAPGVPFAMFKYRGNPGQQYLGVIAQDLEKARPDAVTTGPDGLKRVSPEFLPFALAPKKKG